MTIGFPMRPIGRRGQLGMALIECMIALLIFSVGVLGLVGLEARAINFSADAEDRNRAAVYANEIASQMWLHYTVAPTSAIYTSLISNIAVQSSGGLPNGTITVTAVPGTTNAADIVITWQPPHDVTANLTSKYSTRVVLP